MFDWQTDEHEGWRGEQLAETAVSSTSPLFAKKELLLLLFVIFCIGGGVGLLMWRTRQAVVQQEEALANAHQFVLTAVYNQDSELLTTILSARDPLWVTELQTQTEAGQLLSRPQFGLTLQPQPGAPIDFELSPDLMAAEVSYEQPYESDWSEEPILLRHTAVYRMGRLTWLYSPPDAEYWGEWQVEPHRRIKLTYPQRDQLESHRLAIHLDERLEAMCRDLPTLDCPNAWRLDLRLDHHRQSLSNLQELQAFLGRAGLPSLPTPSLVGIPVDDASRQQIWQGYEQYTITAAIAELTDYECCDRIHIFEALLDWQLAELGYKSWPMTAVSYKTLLLRDASPWDSALLWQESSQASHKLETYGLVEFLINEMGVDAVTLQRALADNEQYSDWLQPFVSEQADEVAAAWDAFVMQQAETAVTLIDSSIPSTVNLVCEVDRETVGRFQYDFTNQEAMLIEEGIRPFAPTCLVESCRDSNALSSPNGERHLTKELLNNPVNQEIIMWQDGREQIVGFGHAPFWFDEEFVGYVNEGEPSDAFVSVEEVWRANIFERTVHAIFTTDVLYEAIPVEERPDFFIVQKIISRPTKPEQLIIKSITSSRDSFPEAFFLVTLNESFSELQSVSYLGQLMYQTDFQIVGNGRFLQITGLTGRRITLIDMDTLDQHQVTTNARVSFLPLWTPDGHAFLQFRTNYFLLYEPATENLITLPHNFSFCTSPTWK